MADARDVGVWTNHAVEQWNTNRQPHKFNDDYILRKWLLKTNSASVIDFGCGGGLWRNLFKGFLYAGFDQNDNMIRHAKKRFPDEKDSFFLIDWYKLPLDDNSVDLVFTSAVLQHNIHEHKKLIYNEFRRVLKPGGYYLCTENTFREDNYKHTFPNVPSWNPALDDGYSFTKDGWNIFLSKFGFSMQEFKEPSEYLFKVSK